MNKLSYCVVLVGFFAITSCQNQENKESDNFKVKGEYLGEIPPDSVPKVFADGFISTSLYTRDFAMMPDGKEIYYCISAMGYNLIYYTKQQPDESWTEPKPATFITDYRYMYYEPCITADGQKMFFLSDCPKEGGKESDEDIWCVDRLGDSWSEPYNIGSPVNTEGNEFYPSVTNNGTLYFTRQAVGNPDRFIYRSKLVNGSYAEPEKLPAQVNCGTTRFNAYIAPDESYIIVPADGMPDSYGGIDYYVCFRNADDTWTEPVNMGKHMNTALSREFSTTLSRDGKYLFFMTERQLKNKSLPGDLALNKMLNRTRETLNGSSNIFWVDASFIKKLKK